MWNLMLDLTGPGGSWETAGYSQEVMAELRVFPLPHHCIDAELQENSVTPHNPEMAFK